MIRSKKEDPKVPASVELEKISYIEDAELNKYILSAKERRFKTALWELINRDFLEVATAASEQRKASVDKSQDTRKSGKEEKAKRGLDGNTSNQNQALPNKALEQDAKKKKVKLSVSSDPDIINDAMENRIGEEIHEFTFIDDEE